MQEQYIHDYTYHAAVDELETIARTFDPAAPDILRTRIIEALSGLGIWPTSCSANTISLELLQKAA